MTVKIISLNIWFGGYLQDSAIAFLKAQNADIVVLQEAFDGDDSSLDARYRTIQVLKKHLNLTYHEFAPNRNQPYRSAQMGNAILSRFPIMPNALGDSLDGSYNLQGATINTPMGEMNVFNLHGVWDLDGNSFSPERREMSRHVIEAIQGKQHVVLAGDINAKPTNEAVVAIGAHLKSVFGDELKTTFNMRRKDNEGYASAAVDMILIGPDLRAVEYDCPDVDISDHLPLVATLDFI